MEALNIFFKEVNKITNEYSQKEKCEMPSVFNQAKENKDFIELTEKIKAGSEIQISDIERFAEKLVIPDSIAKAFEAISPQDLFSIFMLPDVGFELENECISLLRNKLFSLSPIDRDIYAGIFAREFDSKLYCEFDVIDYIYEKGYITYPLEHSITAYMDAVIETFAEFNINLVEYLKKDSDFEQEFGDYNDFRAKKYAEKSTPEKEETPEDASEATKKDREQEDITTYLNLDSNQKKKWLYQGMQCDTVKELAKFIAQSYTEKILCKIPSKKGGGLWNLAKAAFQIEDTATNRKTIENEFNLAYKPPLIPNKFK